MALAGAARYRTTASTCAGDRLRGLRPHRALRERESDVVGRHARERLAVARSRNTGFVTRRTRRAIDRLAVGSRGRSGLILGRDPNTHKPANNEQQNPADDDAMHHDDSTVIGLTSARVYVLRLPDARVAAFCSCWVIVDELHINTIAVDMSRRRQGLGRALMQHILTAVAGEGVRRATLEVRRSNLAALRLYEDLGFEVAGVRKRYYTNPEEDALILWRETVANDSGSPDSAPPTNRP